MQTLARILVVGAMLGSGCAQEAAFNAAERATAISPAGYVAAEYDITVDGGQLGEVKVWSKGAYEEDVSGDERTFVHVGFDIDNETGDSLQLDPTELYLDSAAEESASMANIAPARVDGAITVPPRGSSRVEVLFPLPEGIEPDDVSAFRVHWVLTDGRHTYAQRTPFLQAPDPYYYYYSPFYDPFYDPWAYGRFGPTSPLMWHDYPYRHYPRW